MKLVEITIPSAMDLTKRSVRPAVFSAMIRINKIIAEFGAERNIDLTIELPQGKVHIKITDRSEE